VNHVRYIRSLPGVPYYTMPADWFGIYWAPPRVEPSFGGLSISSPSGGNFPITWIGRQCVTLQSTTNIAGTWQDLPGTEGASATNWPISGGTRFFRLQRAP
jgi:hypothetical protein